MQLPARPGCTGSRAVSVFVLLCWLFAAAPAMGHADNRDGKVAVGGVEILTVRFPAAGLTVKQRADAVTERLNAILSDPNLKASDIEAVPLGKRCLDGAEIVVKGRLFITVDCATARYNKATPIDLARAWLKHLRRVLPALNVKPNPNNH